MRNRRLVTLTDDKPLPWYLSGGVSAQNCIAAYTPQGSISLAASYKNQAQSGIYDLTVGSAPTWTVNQGWSFSGTKYLATGIPASIVKSVIVKFSDLSISVSAMYLCGCYVNPNFFAVIPKNGGKVLYVYGSDLTAEKSPNMRTDVVVMAGTKAYRNGVDEGLTIVTGTPPTTQIYIAARNDNPTAKVIFTGNIQAVAFYDCVLTPDQVTQITRSVNSLLDGNIIFHGDSITTGKYASFNASYPEVLAPNYLNYSSYNIGVEGKLVSEMVSENITGYDTAKQKKIICMLGGINDLYNSASGLDTYNNIVTYHTAKKAAGYKTITMSVFPAATVTGAKETQRQDLNTRIAADHSYADGYVDLSGDARLQNTADTTYFNADGVHLTNAGYAVIAALVKPVLDGLV